MADNLDIQWVPFPADLVFQVDRIVELAKGSQGAVQSQGDLKVLREIYELFRKYYPEANKDMEIAVKHFKTYEKEKGISKEGSAMIQHQIEVPERLYQLISAVYPNQKWDRKFVRILVQAIPETKATNAKI